MGRNNFTAFIYGKQSGRCIGSRKPRRKEQMQRSGGRRYVFEDKLF